MTETKNFGDVSWAEYAPHPGAGWRMPSDPSRYISVDDPYWGRVLDSARNAYGDPNIRFDTGQPSNRYDGLGDVAQPRHLVFGDGTRLPADGTVVYHDAVTKHDWAQNKDGTASLMGPDGHPGPPVAPAGYRKIGDQYAPVNVNGQQIAPQLGGVPNSDNGFHTDPKTGVLTPKNSNGDYYTLGPDGKKHFFDKANAPITEDQYNDQHRAPAASAPDESISTDEQQSGHAADAVKKLQAELKQRFTTISGAEEKLSEVLLTAHATTTAGQAKLNEIQKNIVAAVNNPAMDTTTAAGEKAYLTFLRSQVSAIRDLLSSSSLNAEDQSKAAQALAALYAADNASTTSPPASPEVTEPGAPAPQQPGLTSPDLGGGGFTDPGLGPVTPMPDPYLNDVMGGMPGGNPLGADPMSALASMLPGALGSLGGAASPLEGLGGLASPLAGLGAGLGSQAGPAHATDAVDKVEDKPEPSKQDKTDASSEDKVEPAKAEPKSPVPGSQPDQQSNEQPGSPPAPVATPAPASPVVNLPDGSTSNARTPGSAQAVRDYLAGGTIDAAYRQNGMTLPPVGTPVTNPVDPTRLTCGDVAMFKDHYEQVLSSVKGYLNGQVVPLGQVISSPNFLGFIDPTAQAAATGPATAPPAGLPAPPAPAAPPSPLTAPMAGAPAPAGLPSG